MVQFKRYPLTKIGKLCHRVNVDIETDPGFILTGAQPHPDDPDNEDLWEHGYIIFRIDLGASASTDGRFVIGQNK